MKNSWAATLLGGLLCLCLSVCGVLGALELTLFKEGYLAEKMEDAGYFSVIADRVRADCQGYAMDAGVTVSVIDDFLEKEYVKTDILMNMDARFRNSTSGTGARFSGLTVALEDAIYKETGKTPSDGQRAIFSSLQISCEGTYQQAVRPPFETVLNVLLQYRACRQWAWCCFIALGAGAAALLKKASGTKQGWLRALTQAAVGAGLALAVLAALLRWAVPYQDWMPRENISYELFCRWWGGVSFALAGIALLLGVTVAVYGLWNRRQAQAAHTQWLYRAPPKKEP